VAQRPNLARSSISVRNTVEVPELKVILSALDDDFVGGSNIKQLIHEAALDGARLKLERLVMPTAGNTSLGPPTVMFDGRVGQVQITATGAVIQVKGDVVIESSYGTESSNPAPSSTESAANSARYYRSVSMNIHHREREKPANSKLEGVSRAITIGMLFAAAEILDITPFAGHIGRDAAARPYR
jgi:hypothetical protein